MHGYYKFTGKVKKLSPNSLYISFDGPNTVTFDDG